MGELAERAKTIYSLIGKLESPSNKDWRDASKAQDEEKLAAAQKAIAAVQPVPLKFEISK